MRLASARSFGRPSAKPSRMPSGGAKGQQEAHQVPSPHTRRPEAHPQRHPRPSASISRCSSTSSSTIPAPAAAARPLPAVAATVSFFRGGRKAFESEPARTDTYTKERRSVPVEFQIPLADLQPGRYVVQLNVIDEQGRKFAFQRSPLILLPARIAGD